MLSRGEGPRLTPHKAALAVLGALYVHYAKSEIGAASREADRPDAAALGVWLLRKLNMQAPLLYEPTFAALQRELEEIGLRGTAAHLKRKLMVSGLRHANAQSARCGHGYLLAPTLTARRAGRAPLARCALRPAF
jgi:hypothetical protein